MERVKLVKLKFRFNPDAPSIVVRGIVEGPTGEAQVRLVLDTGASFTLFSWKILESIGYDLATVKERVTIITASGVESASKLRVKRLMALGKEVKDAEVVCHDLPAEARVDGLLGLSFLSKFDVYLRFREGVIEVC